MTACICSTVKTMSIVWKQITWELKLKKKLPLDIFWVSISAFYMDLAIMGKWHASDLPHISSFVPLANVQEILCISAVWKVCYHYHHMSIWVLLCLLMLLYLSLFWFAPVVGLEAVRNKTLLLSGEQYSLYLRNPWFKSLCGGQVFWGFPSFPPNKCGSSTLK